MSVVQGNHAESLAKAYLLKQGLRFITHNFRSRLGEIDLIMQDKDVLVFIEVRARSSNGYGGALSSVTLSKQRKLVKTALYYLLKHNLHDKLPMRFDVVSLDGAQWQITWIKNAFDADV